MALSPQAGALVCISNDIFALLVLSVISEGVFSRAESAGPNRSLHFLVEAATDLPKGISDDETLYDRSPECLAPLFRWGRWSSSANHTGSAVAWL
jgi:hypothetical protein